MFGDHPVELGLEQPGTSMLARLRRASTYTGVYFPTRSPTRPMPFTRSERHAARWPTFERTIISGPIGLRSLSLRSRQRAISPAARKRRAAVLQSASVVFLAATTVSVFPVRTRFRGTSRRRDAESTTTPASTTSTGRFVSGAQHGCVQGDEQVPKDMGFFKAPSCATSPSPRPTCTTAASRARRSAGPLRGGRAHDRRRRPSWRRARQSPTRAPSSKGFHLLLSRRLISIAFLNALTDNDLLNDTRFANPWTARHEEAR